MIDEISVGIFIMGYLNWFRTEIAGNIYAYVKGRFCANRAIMIEITERMWLDYEMN